MIRKSKIFEILLSDLSYDDLITITSESIIQKKKLTIGYCTAHILNLAYNDDSLKTLLNSFYYLHIDGLGASIASKILYGKNNIKNKITGSDFYSLLIKESLKQNWSFYFLGDSKKVLQKIYTNLPKLNIAGMHDGFNFEDGEIINEINKQNVDIFIVGLGTPRQEQWIIKNRDYLSANIIFAVGDGIKIFAGTKRRGPAIIQHIGLEWLVRLIANPVKMWRRYLIGIPQFLMRVILNKRRIN